MDSRHTSPTEFDIVRVTPHLDLVLFDNVISCYQSDGNITANYLLGQDVTQSGWDWVGIFRLEWRHPGEYEAYTWAQVKPIDCTAPRRRSVLFPPFVHRLSSDAHAHYQFMYVSSAISGSSDEYEVLNELQCPAPCKRPRHKEKVLHVFRDTQTLINSPTFSDWAEKLRFINFTPIVQEYTTTDSTSVKPTIIELPLQSTSGKTPASTSAVVPYQSRALLPVYSTHWSPSAVVKALQTSGQAQHMLTCSPMIPSIEYPILKQLLGGPLSFLETPVNSQCVNCQFARQLVSDQMQKEASLEQQVKRLQGKIVRLKIARQTQRVRQTSAVTLVDWALSEVLDENRKLREHMDALEERLADSRTTTSEVRHQHADVTTETDDEYESWIVKDPKRIARLKRLVGRQSHVVQMLRQNTEAHRKLVAALTSENIKLRTLVSSALESSDRFRELSNELNRKIRSVLAARAKDHTNQWRQFFRQSQETDTQTDLESSAASSSADSNEDADGGSAPKVASPSTIAAVAATGNRATTSASQKRRPKNKQIMKLMRSEKPANFKLHKERKQAEACPTCGLKFSCKADRRDIEEHIGLHGSGTMSTRFHQ
ncbi:CACO2-like protein [Mya arenaria]|uniref:CACO2-like protein n=1 Tax=Mya arenaria TaxID=6604 RepID=A0ABY7E9G9_MYAAR|nr:CACO2-like protein [Mya arenaria]